MTDHVFMERSVSEQLQAIKVDQFNIEFHVRTLAHVHLAKNIEMVNKLLVDRHGNAPN
jgi:hypothetical protein